MPNQAQIEKAAGIDKTIAEFIMKQETPAARSAMQCLKLCVSMYEHAGFELLKCTIEDCKRELKMEELEKLYE
jgi:hypothetical protein